MGFPALLISVCLRTVACVAFVSYWKVAALEAVYAKTSPALLDDGGGGARYFEHATTSSSALPRRLVSQCECCGPVQGILANFPLPVCTCVCVRVCACPCVSVRVRAWCRNLNHMAAGVGVGPQAPQKVRRCPSLSIRVLACPLPQRAHSPCRFLFPCTSSGCFC